MQIDEIDRKLLAILSDDARTPVADLARRLNLARSTVQARLERLETRELIAGYTIRRGTALRSSLRATVLISAEPRSTGAILSRLRTLSSVESVHTTSGRFDLLVTLNADTTEDLDRTLDTIGEAQGVKASESLIHLSTKLDRSV